jgi:acyl-CoA hydrolase/GNAT superfamily N-acetyltransferase
MKNTHPEYLELLKEKYPQKFTTPERAFTEIRRGNELFVASACGEPRYLMRSLAEYTAKNPKAFFDVEVIHFWNLGPAEYTAKHLSHNFRLNSFFVCGTTENAVASGLADYTPMFPYQMPRAFRRGFIDIDVALIQVSLPDAHGYMSLGVSVDIVKSAVERAEIVIAQVNSCMPRVPGDTFVHIDEINYLIPFDEPLLEYRTGCCDERVEKIGRHVSALVRDGDTIQTGFGPVPEAVLKNLSDKKDLGIHTDVLTDGMVALMRSGAVNNKKKSRDRGKTVAALCAGAADTFEYLRDNPMICFKTLDYTNSPLVIASQENMLSINEVYCVDLTGQTTEEDPESAVPRGMAGQADFIRGTSMAAGGTTIIAITSTSEDGSRSRIVARLHHGAAVSNMRCDAEYVVTEYGTAFLHGKSLRERALALIGIAHPCFRQHLLEEAKQYGFVSQDQTISDEEGGLYPEQYVNEMALKNGDPLLLRPVKTGDEDLLKDFLYSLSDASIKRRFMNARLDMPRERLERFSVVNYSNEMVILAVQKKEDEAETVMGMCEYRLDRSTMYGEAAFAVRDDCQGTGLGTLLLKYLTRIAVKEGLNGFTAEVLVGNTAMMRLFEKMNFDIHKKLSDGVYELRMGFRRDTNGGFSSGHPGL